MYSGDGAYTAPPAVSATVTINKGATSTALTSSANPSAPGVAVSLIATVTRNAGSGVPTGRSGS